jgi:hypothetical protein
MKQKHFPRELMIKDSIWKIKFVRELEGDCLGLCDPGEKIIYIKQGQSYQERLDSVLHEVLHAINFEYNFEIKHQHVYKLAEAMARIYVENF